MVVILPAYNERLTIVDTILDFAKELPKAKIIVIDNNSNDGTFELAWSAIIENNIKGEVLFEPFQGKGFAMRKAFKEFDADAFQYAKEQTTFTKMQQKNSKDVPDEIKFYRKGGSNYINELSKNEQNILQNWPGLKELNIRINEKET